MARPPIPINPIDAESIRAGDPNAVADAIISIYDVITQQVQREAARIGRVEAIKDIETMVFSTDTGAWTVTGFDIARAAMLRIDDLLFVQGYFIETTVDTNANQLRLQLPRGFQGADIGVNGRNVGCGAYTHINGGTVSGPLRVYVDDTSTFIALERLGPTAGAQWLAAASRIDVEFAILLHIAPLAGT